MDILYISGLTAAFAHFCFFLLESVLWGSGPVNRIFGVPEADRSSRTARLFAFNIGFYNLFLSMGTLLSLYGLHVGHLGAASVLAFCCLFMVGAGLVLLLSGGLRRLLGVLLQAGPAAVCLFMLFR